MPADHSILEKLNAYNLNVTRDLIEHVLASEAKNERVFLLLSHIVNSQQVWLERISGKSMSVKPFDLRPMNELKTQNQLNYDLTGKFITESDLDEKIKYVNTKRQRFENSISEMFMHLFNHASYHRGQINQLLVQEGKQAMPADFIIYNRTELSA